MLLSLNEIGIPQFVIASSNTVNMFTALPTTNTAQVVPLRRSMRHALMRWSVHELKPDGAVGARMRSHLSVGAAHRTAAELNAIVLLDPCAGRAVAPLQFVVVDRRRNLVVDPVAASVVVYR